MWYISFEYRISDMTIHIRSIRPATLGQPAFREWFLSNAVDELGAYLEFVKHIRENTSYEVKEQ